MSRLPNPKANMTEYNRIMELRFKKVPACKDNYEKYMKMINKGYDIETQIQPIKMDYEVSSHCNFRCTMCLISELGNNRPANMTFEDFKNSIDNQHGLIEIKLQGLGEPLLNPDFFKMVDYATENYIWTRTTTNASLLHIKDNYKKLIDSKIGEIQISVDATNKETFESIRRGSNFEQIIDNCRLINKYAESKNEQWRTSCWMLVQKENANQIEEMIELAAKMKFTRLTYSIAISDWSHDAWKEINAGKEVFELFTDSFVDKLVGKGKELGIEVTFWDGKDKYTYDKKRDKLCNWLWGRAYITSDMRIVPCCVIVDKKVCDMGDAKCFQEEWKGQKYVDIRNQHLQGNIPKMCINCYSRTDKK